MGQCGTPHAVDEAEPATNAAGRRAQGNGGNGGSKRRKAGGASEKRKFKAKFKRRCQEHEIDAVKAGPLARRCSREELAGARRALGNLVRSQSELSARRGSRPSLAAIGEDGDGGEKEGSARSPAGSGDDASTS